MSEELRLPTKCCGKTGEPYPVMWNPGNAVVQCHICGAVYEPEATADQLRAAIAQERDRIFAALQEEIDHSDRNDKRLGPPFGRGKGELAVPVSYIEAVMERFGAIRGQAEGER